MRSVRLILLVMASAFLLYSKYSSVSSYSNPDSSSVTSLTGPGSSVDESIPPKVLNVLQVVRSTGLPPEGYVGGRVFQNREGRLPADGDYREFDVDPHQGGRNAERIIVEWNTKKAWYTVDHYQTFVPLP